MFIWQAGGEVISEDLSSCPIDSPEAIQGAQFYGDIIFNEEYAPAEATIKEQGFGEMVKAGKVAMFFGGAADDLDYAHKKDPAIAEMKVALVPKGPKNRQTFSYVASTVISAKTGNADAAYQALVALSDGHPPLESRRPAAIACHRRHHRRQHARQSGIGRDDPQSPARHARLPHHPPTGGLGRDLLGGVQGPALP